MQAEAMKISNEKQLRNPSRLSKTRISMYTLSVVPGFFGYATVASIAQGDFKSAALISVTNAIISIPTYYGLNNFDKWNQNRTETLWEFWKGKPPSSPELDEDMEILNIPYNEPHIAAELYPNMELDIADAWIQNNVQI